MKIQLNTWEIKEYIFERGSHYTAQTELDFVTLSFLSAGTVAACHHI